MAGRISKKNCLVLKESAKKRGPNFLMYFLMNNVRQLIIKLTNNVNNATVFFHFDDLFLFCSKEFYVIGSEVTIFFRLKLLSYFYRFFFVLVHMLLLTKLQEFTSSMQVL